MSATQEKASVSLAVSRQIGPIDVRIYSAFTEHMGRCIYGGIYEENSSLSDENGFRQDVLKAMRDLAPPLVRYPGGNFVSNYHWRDGVGPKQDRPKMLELAWLSVETNKFGTDEFMAWCNKLEAEAIICLNMGSGTMEEAMNWLTYMNSSADVYYANLRRKHGHEKPYGVKYIGLGNEMWGPWQIGQLPPQEYAQKARQWAKALKLIDPSIQLVSCGKEGNDEWDWIVLRELCDLVDYHSIHLYSKSTLYEPFYKPDPTSLSSHYVGVFAPLAAEKAIEITHNLIDLACLQRKVTKRPKIAFDEWNVWDPVLAPGEEGAEMHYTLTDALAVTTFLNVFIRQSQKVAIANIAQAVNVIAPIMTNSTGMFKQTIYHVLYLYRKFMTGTALAVHVNSPTYDGPTYPSWLPSFVKLPYIDVVACTDETESTLCISITNRHEEKTFTLDLDLGIGSSRLEKGLKAKTYTLTGRPDQRNDFGKEEISIIEDEVELQQQLSMKACTLTLFVIKL